MTKYTVPLDIRGAGGGKGGGSSSVAEEDPNTLRSNNIINIIEVLGEGPIYGLVDGLKSVYLDKVSVQNDDDSYNYNGLTVITRNGYPDQTAIPNSNGIETEYAVGTEVSQAVPIIESFTNPEADFVRVKIQIQALSYQDKSTGDLKGARLRFLVEIKQSGEGDSEWRQVANKLIEGKTVSPYQVQVKAKLPGTGPTWQVRVTRVTDDERGSNFQDTMYYASLTAVVNAKLTYPDTALVGIQASAQEFGTTVPDRAYHVKGLIIKVPANYNPDTRVYTGTWNGQFKEAYTNNPAWILYDLVTNTRYGAKQTQFDKWSLYSIGQYCDELVPDGYGGEEPRFTCNTVITAQEDAYIVIDSIASIFRGMVYWASSKIAAVSDMPKTPDMTFTRANIVDDFIRSGTSLKARHSVVLVTWNDPDDFYSSTIEMVTDQEMIKKWGWRQTEVTAFACTSRGQALRTGKWLMYTEKLETESISFTATSDALALTPGSVINISDPAVTGVRLAGRLLSTGNYSLTLDHVDGIDVNEDWNLTVAMPDGGSETRAVVDFNGKAVTVEPGFSAVPVDGAVWNLSSTSVVPETFRVLSVSDPGVELQPKITAVTHNAGKFALVEENIPLPEKIYSLLPTGKLQPPTNLTAVQHTYLAGVNKQQAIAVGWTPSEDVRTSSYRLETMPAGEYDWEEVYAGTGVQFTVKDADSGEWSFRVRGVDSVGGTSVWTYLVQDVNNTLLPTMPTDVEIDVGTMRITIRPVGDINNQYWELRRSEVALQTADIDDNSVKIGVGTEFVDTELFPLTTYYYYVRGTNTFGNSDWYPFQARTEGGADAYLEMLSEKIDKAQLSTDLQEEVEKISGTGTDSVNERVNAVSDRVASISTELSNTSNELNLSIEEIDGRVEGINQTLTAADTALSGRVDDISSTVEDIQEHAESESDRLDQSVQAVSDALDATKQNLEDRGDEIEQAYLAAVDRLDQEDTAISQTVIELSATTQGIQDSLESEALRLDGRVTEVANTASDARDQINQTATELNAMLDSTNEAIVLETAIREQEGSKLITSLSALQAATDSTSASLAEFSRLAINQDRLDAVRIAAMEVTNRTTSAYLRVEENARVEGDTALAQRITTLDARVDDTAANITTVDQARVDGDSALASRIGELSAKIDATPQFSSGFEPGTDFDQWLVDSTATLTEVTDPIYLGTRSALITSTNTAADPGGNSSEVRAIIPTGATESFAGYEVVITAAIRMPDTNASSEMAIGYSTNGVGNSGWFYFTPTATWTTVECRYNVPATTVNNDDYIGLWADTSGSGKAVLIDAVNIRRADAEITEITAALETEQQARVSGDAALASDLTNLSANFQGVAADLTEETSVRASETAANAQAVTNLQTSFDDQMSQFTDSLQVLSDADSSLATRTTNLESRAATATAGILAEQETRAAADETLTNQFNSANSRIDDAAAALTAEAQTRASEDTALTNQISSANSRIGDAEADISAEASTRASRDNALTTLINTANSRIGDAEAAITSEASTRANEDQALSNRTDTLTTRVADAEAGILQESEARADLQEAVASQLDVLSATLGDSEASYNQKIEVLANESSATAYRVDSLRTSLDGVEGDVSSLQTIVTSSGYLQAVNHQAMEVAIGVASAAIRVEEQTRVTEDTALAVRSSVIEAKVADAEAAITAEETARSDADSALTTQMNSATSRIGDAEAAITSEASTRASADSSLTTQLNSLDSRVGSAESSITSEAQTRAAKDATLTTQISSANSRIDDAEAAITSEAQTRASKDNTLTTQISTANSRIGAAEASVTSEAQTRASADSSLTSKINSANSRIDDTEASISSEASTRVSKDNALGSRIDSVQATVGNNTSAINTEKTARASGDSALATAMTSLQADLEEADARIISQASVAVEGKSLARDGSFSNGDYAYWSDFHAYIEARRDTAGTLEATAPAAYYSRYRTLYPGTVRYVTSSYESVVPGSQYSCSLSFARVASGNGTFSMSLQFYGLDGEVVSWPSVLSVNLTSYLSWEWHHSVSRLVTVPEGAVKGRVVLKLSSDNTTGSVAFTAVKAALADSAITTELDSAVSRIADSEAAITAEASTRASADSALTSQVNSAVSRIGTAETAITSEASTRVSKDNALGSRIDSLTSTVGNNTSAINTEKTARASGDSALATSLSDLTAAMEDSNASIQSQITASVSGKTLVTDGSFSSGDFSGWTGTSHLEMRERNVNGNALYADAPAEYFSIYNSTNTGSPRYSTSTFQPVVPGDTYTCSYWFAKTGYANGDFALTVQFYDLAGDLVLWQTVYEDGLWHYDPWEWVSSGYHTITVPEGAVKGRVAMRLSDNNTQGGVGFTAVKALLTDSAVTNAIAAAVSRIGDTEASITSEATTRASADNSLTSQINSANSRIGDAESLISTETATRVSKDNALGVRVDNVISTVGSANAAITSEAATRAAEDGALSSRIDTLSANVGDTTAALQQQATATVEGASLVPDGSFSAGVDLWGNTTHVVLSDRDPNGGGFHSSMPAAHSVIFVDDNHGTTRHVTTPFMDVLAGDIYSFSTWYARVSGADGRIRFSVQWYNDEGSVTWPTVAWFDLSPLTDWTWYKSDPVLLEVPEGATKGRVLMTMSSDNTKGRGAFTGVKAFRTDSALAELVNTVQTSLGDDLVSVQQTMSAEYDSLDSRLGSNYSALDSRLTSETNSLDSIISSLDSRLSGETSSLDSIISSLDSRLSGETSSLSADYTALDARLRAKWGVVLDNNGYVSGFGQENDGTTATTIFRTDLFGIAPPGANAVYPFIVSGNKTIMDEALIETLTIGKLRSSTGGVVVTGNKIKAEYIEADQLEVEWAKIKNVSIGTADIESAAITSAKIKNAAVSTLQLDGQAVTIPESNSRYGVSIRVNTSSISYDDQSIIIAVSPTLTGNPVLISVAFNVQMRVGTSAINTTLMVYSAGELIHATPFFTISESMYAFTMQRNLGSGTKRIEYRLRTSGDFNVMSPLISIIEVKR